MLIPQKIGDCEASGSNATETEDFFHWGFARFLERQVGTHAD